MIATLKGPPHFNVGPVHGKGIRQPGQAHPDMTTSQPGTLSFVSRYPHFAFAFIQPNKKTKQNKKSLDKLILSFLLTIT